MDTNSDALVQDTHYERRAGFTQVSNVVLRGYPELTADVKLTYMVLDSFAWKDRKTFPGQETLAEVRGLRVETISKHLHQLEQVGLIEIIQRGKKQTNVYYLLPIPKERVDEYLSRWALESDLTRNASHSTQEGQVTCRETQVTTGGDLTRNASPQEKDEGTYEEDEETTRVSSPEDLRLIENAPDNHSTKAGRKLQRLLARYTGHDLALVCTYLEIAEEDKRGKAKTDQGKCSRLEELHELQVVCGYEAWRYGLEECRRLGKAGTAYAKAVMEGYNPEQHRKQGGTDKPGTISDKEWEQIMLHRQSLIAQGLDPDGEEEY